MHCDNLLQHLCTQHKALTEELATCIATIPPVFVSVQAHGTELVLGREATAEEHGERMMDTFGLGYNEYDLRPAGQGDFITSDQPVKAFHNRRNVTLRHANFRHRKLLGGDPKPQFSRGGTER